MGYEPGTKSNRQEIVSSDISECWRSEYSNIDIRHGRTFSPPKLTLESFKHKPTNWRETTLDKIDGWDLNKLFDL